MDEEPKIRDIPTIKKLRDNVQNFSRAKRAMPILGPVLRVLGVDVDEVNSALSKVKDLAHEVEELARVPDEFNEFFADRGWILYDRLSLDVAKAAVQKAKQGDLEGAEADLVAYYDAETVSFGLMSMHGVAAFRPRMTLAEKALVDYREGRYHACVPVVLALLDGMVNEVHQKARGGVRRGISADDIDLSAWDSFAAHQKGLNRLLKVIQKGRHRTTIEPIKVPFRNGIMHGVDLGYDNVTVAAKTWALLFAAREWAIKAECGQLDAPPEPAQLTLKDSWEQLKEAMQKARALEAAQKRIREWRPRQIVMGYDVPRTGPAEAFTPGSPERALAEYLCWWKERNWGYMAGQATVAALTTAKNGPAKLREEFAAKRLLAYTFKSIGDDAPALTTIATELVMELEGETVCVNKDFRLIYAGTDGLPAVTEAGEWAVLTWAL